MFVSAKIVPNKNHMRHRFPYNVIVSNDEIEVVYSSFKSYQGAREMLKSVFDVIDRYGSIAVNYDDGRILRILMRYK